MSAKARKFRLRKEGSKANGKQNGIFIIAARRIFLSTMLQLLPLLLQNCCS